MISRLSAGVLLLLLLMTLGCSRGEAPERVGRGKEGELQATSDYYANIAFQQGNQLLSKGDYERAASSFERAIGYNPRLAGAHCNLGYVHYVQGNHEEAEAKFRKTIQIEPEYVGAYFYLGKLYDKRDLVDEAITQYEKAVEILPRYAAAHFFLAKDYEKKGLVRKALRAYQDYLKYAPDGDGADESRDAIERLAR